MVVVFPSVAAILVAIAAIALFLIVLVGPMGRFLRQFMKIIIQIDSTLSFKVGFIYCFWCVFSTFDDTRKIQENRTDYDEHIVA